MNRLISSAGTILEKSPVQKSMVIAWFLTLLNSYYMLCDLIFVFDPTPWINLHVVYTMYWGKSLCVILAVTMILLRKRLEISPLAQRVVPYLATQFYILTLMPLGYCIGHLSFISGLVVAATPLMCIILFDTAVNIALIVSGVGCYILVSGLYIYGVIPEAPLFTFSDHPDFQQRVFYSAVVVMYCLPLLIAFMLGTFIMVRYWQTREDGVRRDGLTDSLTHLPNRRAISDHLAELLTSRSATTPISVILIDIDFFKKVNDSYGHATGDKVLRSVGTSLKNTLRAGDQIGRYGGEEFLIVLANTSLASAQQIAERCRLHIAAEVIYSSNDTPIHVTASFGIYCSTGAGEDAARLLHLADTQLYRAKENGRNQVCSHDEPVLGNALAASS